MNMPKPRQPLALVGPTSADRYNPADKYLEPSPVKSRKQSDPVYIAHKSKAFLSAANNDRSLSKGKTIEMSDGMHYTEEKPRKGQKGSKRQLNNLVLSKQPSKASVKTFSKHLTEFSPEKIS